MEMWSPVFGRSNENVAPKLHGSIREQKKNKTTVLTDTGLGPLVLQQNVNCAKACILAHFVLALCDAALIGFQCPHIHVKKTEWRTISFTSRIYHAQVF